jgi:hypothetical protein
MDMTSNSEFALDEQKRIAKRKATWEQAEQALAYFEEQGNDEECWRLEVEMALLKPYWKHDGATKEQAVAAYFAVHVDAAERDFARRQTEIRDRIGQLRADLDLLNERRATRGLPPVELDLSFTP